MRFRALLPVFLLLFLLPSLGRAQFVERGVTPLISSQIIVGQGWVSMIFLTNNNPAPMNIRIVFLQDDGSGGLFLCVGFDFSNPRAIYPFTLGPRQSTLIPILQADVPLTQIRQGWFSIEAMDNDGQRISPVGLTGNVKWFGWGGVSGTTLVNPNQYFSVDRADSNTALGIVNTDFLPAEVSVNVYKGNFQVSEMKLSLGPGEKKAGLLWQFSNDLPSLEPGYQYSVAVKVEKGGPIAVNFVKN